MESGVGWMDRWMVGAAAMVLVSSMGREGKRLCTYVGRPWRRMEG